MPRSDKAKPWLESGLSSIERKTYSRPTYDVFIVNTCLANERYQTDSIVDITREQLQNIGRTKTYPDTKVITDLKKRKLLKMQKAITFEVSKGPKYARAFVKEETDLTAEMLARYFSVSSLKEQCLIYGWCSGAWKNVKLKPYNFKSKGALTPSGALHPCKNPIYVTKTLVKNL